MLKWFKMQVRCAHAERIEQHFLQKLNDWCVFDFRNASIFAVVSHHLGAGLVKFKIISDDAFHGLGRSCRRNLHQLGKLVVFSNHPVHAHLGGEFDFFGSFLIGRVCRRNNQPIVALAQHHNAIGLANFVVQQTFGQPLNVDGFEVQQRCRKS